MPTTAIVAEAGAPKHQDEEQQQQARPKEDNKLTEAAEYVRKMNSAEMRLHLMNTLVEAELSVKSAMDQTEKNLKDMIDKAGNFHNKKMQKLLQNQKKELSSTSTTLISLHKQRLTELKRQEERAEKKLRKVEDDERDCVAKSLGTEFDGWFDRISADVKKLKTQHINIFAVPKGDFGIVDDSIMFGSEGCGQPYVFRMRPDEVQFDGDVYEDCTDMLNDVWYPREEGQGLSLYAVLGWDLGTDGFYDIYWGDFVWNMKQDWKNIQRLGTLEGPWSHVRLAAILERVWALIREDTKPPAKKARQS